ncbi:hypothetical protein NDU88_002274 [Pleurodeles waltl]|uniref:Uncharacterized protein n=1 Tax=Pleurodeles waltl TaxID=8319 RepID=A0AAV7TMM6_PLEWA|nr:hypothetical protein NDU88_002274 [Pleurodeles waltl]
MFLERGQKGGRGIQRQRAVAVGIRGDWRLHVVGYAVLGTNYFSTHLLMCDSTYYNPAIRPLILFVLTGQSIFLEISPQQSKQLLQNTAERWATD